MQKETQNISNSTIYIIIIFLSIFIIMPPLCRVVFKEEEEVIEDVPAQVDALSDGKLVCTKNYVNTGLEITSTSTYEGGSIITNIISIKNPILTSDGLTDAGVSEYNEYTTLFSELLNVPVSNQVIDGNTLIITLDKNVKDALGDNDQIVNQMQDSLSLQNSYEVNGYSCTTE